MGEEPIAWFGYTFQRHPLRPLPSQAETRKGEVANTLVNIGGEMYLYFMQGMLSERQRRLVKIGRSKNPEARMADLQTGHPKKLKLLHKIKCKSERDARYAEKVAHRIFRHRRRKGEWFEFRAQEMELLRMIMKKLAERLSQDAK